MCTLAEARARVQLRRTDRGYSAASLNRYINDVRADIASRHKWSWLCDDWNARTVATASVTSVSCTSGSPFITLGSAAPDTLQGKRVLINSKVYRVGETQTSGGTVFVLDQPFIDATASYTMTVLYDEVALPPGAVALMSVGLLTGQGQPFPLQTVPNTQARMLDHSSFGQPWSFSTITRPQIAAPVSAPSAAMSGSGGGPGNGLTFSYWYSYIDKQTRAESALSPAVSFTTTSGNTVTVTFAPRRGFHTRVYRSRNGGGVPFFLTEILSSTTTTATDSTTDLYLARRFPGMGSSVMIKLWPIPSAAYQVVGTVILQSVSLDADSDTPPWPETFDSVWMDGVEAMMLESSDEQGRANQARQRYEAGIARMIREDSPAPAMMIEVGRNARRGIGGKPSMWYGAFTSS